MWRRFLVGVILLAVLIALAAGTLWFLSGNETFLKRQAQAAVMRWTGRELTISGPLRLRLGRTLDIEAEDVALANAAWADAPQMAFAGRLRLALDTGALFDRRVVLQDLELGNCEFRVQRDESGQSNWKFARERRSRKSAWKVRIERLELQDCRLLQQTASRPEPVLIEAQAARFERMPDGRYTVDGTGKADDRPMRLSGHFGPLAGDGFKGPFVHDLSLSAGAITLESRGTIEDLRTGSGANLDMRFSGPEIESVARLLALSEFSTGAFDFRVNLDSAGGATSVDVKGDLGSLDVLARGSLDRLVRPRSGTVDIEAGGPDLGALASALGVGHVPASTFRLEGSARFTDRQVELDQLMLDADGDRVSASGALGRWPELAGTDIRVEVKSADFGRWAPLFRLEEVPLPQFTGKAALRIDVQGAFSVDLDSAWAGNRITYAGTLGTVGSPWQPAGTVHVSSADARAIGLLFGHAGIPATAADLRGSFVRSGKGLRLSGVQLAFDGNRLAVDGELTRQPHFAGSRLAGRFLSPDTAALGRLLGRDGVPQQPLEVAFELQPQGEGLAFRVGDGSLGSWDVELDGVIADARNLRGVSASFDLQLPSLRLAKVLARDGRELPDLPLALSGRLASDGEIVRLQDTSVRLGSTQAVLDASFDPRAGLEGTRLHVSGQGSDWSELLSAPAWLGLPRAFTLEGGLEFGPQNYVLEAVRLSFGDFVLAADGRVDAASGSPVMDLAVQLSGPEGELLHPGLATLLPAGPFDARLRIAGTRDAFTLHDLQIVAGGTQLGAELAVTTGAPPAVTGQIHAVRLDLSHWFDEVEEARADEPDQPRRERVFDDTPVSHLARDDIRLDLDVEAAVVNLGNSLLQDVVLGLAIDDTSFRLEPFRMRGDLGSALSGSFVLDEQGEVPQLDVELNGTDIRLGLVSAPGQPPETFPPLEIALHLEGRGTTFRQLAEDVDGLIRIYSGAGRIAASGINRVFSDFILELFQALNPFAKRNDYTELDCVVLAADVADGRAELSPIVMRTRELTILSKGVIDLRTEQLDLQFNTKPRKGIGISAGVLIKPLLKVGGTLAEPALELDPGGAVVTGGAAVVTMGLSLLAQSLADRYFASSDPCGEARREIAKHDAVTG